MKVAQSIDDLVQNHTHSARVERSELLQNVLKIPMDVVSDYFEGYPKLLHEKTPKLLLLNIFRKLV